MRSAWLAVIVSALLLVGAGCGGGDDEAADDTDVTFTDTTLDETTTGEETDGSSVDGLASEDCLQLATIGAAISQAFTGAGDDDETSELFDDLFDKAPDEIRTDLRTVADGYEEYADALADLDLGEGQAPSAEDLQAIQAAIASIDQVEVQAAAERLSAWAETNCPGS